MIEMVMYRDEMLPAAGSCPHETTGYINGGIQFKSFAWLYDRLFDVIDADTEMHKERAHFLRYKIYCEEHKVIDPKVCIGQLEKDKYDGRAKHSLLIRKGRHGPIGTARVILPDHNDLAASFPMQEHCHVGRLKDELMLSRMCQISRLCVIKDFRSRDGDQGLLPEIYYQDVSKKRFWICDGIAKRFIPFGPIGLIKNAFKLAIENGCDRACMMLDQKMIHTFESLGMICEKIGATHKDRHPVIIDFLHSLNNMKVTQPAVWEVMTSNGRMHKDAIRLRCELESRV